MRFPDLNISRTEQPHSQEIEEPAPGLSALHRDVLSLVSPAGVSLASLCLSLAARFPGAEPIQRRALLRVVFDLEDRGLVEIHLPCHAGDLNAVYQGIRTARRLCRDAPGLWNVVAYEREWDLFGPYFDFLDERSPNYLLKRFQRRIYMDRIGRYLDANLAAGSRVVDVGGGIGRFGDEFVRRDLEVFLVDASEKALKCAARHFEEKGYDRYLLHWGDAGDLAAFEDGFFTAAFALELVCYCTSPERAVTEIARVTAPGGWLFFSVEGKYGSMLSDPKIGVEHFRAVYDTGVLLKKNDVYVRYYAEQEFRGLLESAGLQVVELAGTHYVPDGIFHRYIGEMGLGSEEAERVIWEIEQECSRDPVLKPLARAWLAVCRKPAD